ncbi:MAG: zinc metallopeptidase [Candidatus Hydrogenedentes bacterium]|nr:zinc metallopeptidase [Candidatus Hydrogenedentota bacterium]
MMFDPISITIMVVTGALSLWAQARVKSAYHRNAQIATRSGMTGADIARLMMRNENINDVELEVIPGELTDHYDPRAKVVRLSQAVYHGNSIASLGIAAHEVGHVIQHAHGYAPMHLRSIVYPVASIGSGLGPWLVVAGIVMQFPGLLWAGVFLFAAATAFTVVTLPVEFNASSRALHALEYGNVLLPDEMKGARQVLNAAALTYVAAAVTSILWLLHYVMMANQDRE